MDVPSLISELTRDEGLRLFPYLDTKGKWTIGVGHNLTDRGISKAIAASILEEDIQSTLADLDAHIPMWRSLTEVRQRVLANMCLNLGINRLLGFTDMLAALKSGDYDAAAREMLDSKWAREDVGQRANRLAALMAVGEIQA